MRAISCLKLSHPRPTEHTSFIIGCTPEKLLCSGKYHAWKRPIEASQEDAAEGWRTIQQAEAGATRKVIGNIARGQPPRLPSKGSKASASTSASVSIVCRAVV